MKYKQNITEFQKKRPIILEENFGSTYKSEGSTSATSSVISRGISLHCGVPGKSPDFPKNSTIVFKPSTMTQFLSSYMPLTNPCFPLSGPTRI